MWQNWDSKASNVPQGLIAVITIPSYTQQCGRKMKLSEIHLNKLKSLTFTVVVMSFEAKYV